MRVKRDTDDNAVALHEIPDIQTLPEATSGKVKVWSDPGSATAMKVSAVLAVAPSKTMPDTPKTSLSADNAGSPESAWDSSRDKVRAAPSEPEEPPARPVMADVLALAT